MLKYQIMFGDENTWAKLVVIEYFKQEASYGL